MTLPFEADLFKILICPDSKADLKFYDNTLVSCDEACRRAYPIEDGIPVMLKSEARPLTTDEKLD